MLALLLSLARNGTSISPEADPKIYDLDPQNQISRKAKTLVPAAGHVGSALSPVEAAEDKAAAYGDRVRRQWGEGTPSPYWLRAASGEPIHYKVPQAPERAVRRQWLPANPKKHSPPHPHLGTRRPAAEPSKSMATPCPQVGGGSRRDELCPSCPWPQAGEQLPPLE